jgi:hypothetical protein
MAVMRALSGGTIPDRLRQVTEEATGLIPMGRPGYQWREQHGLRRLITIVHIRSCICSATVAFQLGISAAVWLS